MSMKGFAGIRPGAALEDAEEFLYCCQVLRENGITPIGINRWYAMTVFAMARGSTPFYQAENTDEIIPWGSTTAASKISEYMLEGFRFFKELVDQGMVRGQSDRGGWTPSGRHHRLGRIQGRQKSPLWYSRR